jgi:hypothetical protein
MLRPANASLALDNPPIQFALQIAPRQTTALLQFAAIKS